MTTASTCRPWLQGCRAGGSEQAWPGAWPACAAMQQNRQLRLLVRHIASLCLHTACPGLQPWLAAGQHRHLPHRPAWLRDAQAPALAAALPWRRILDNLPIGMVRMRDDDGEQVKTYERGFPVGFADVSRPWGGGRREPPARRAALWQRWCLGCARQRALLPGTPAGRFPCAQALAWTTRHRF